VDFMWLSLPFNVGSDNLFNRLIAKEGKGNKKGGNNRHGRGIETPNHSPIARMADNGLQSYFFRME